MSNLSISVMMMMMMMVVHRTYMFALAREMECIPSLSKWLFTNPRVFASLAFGQAHAPLFRLEGPYQLKEAQNICAKELLKPILQRPLFMNSAFAVNALFFASVNITASLVSRVWRYTVEDFVADMVDLSYQSREFMDRTKVGGPVGGGMLFDLLIFIDTFSM